MLNEPAGFYEWVWNVCKDRFYYDGYEKIREVFPDPENMLVSIQQAFRGYGDFNGFMPHDVIFYSLKSTSYKKGIRNNNAELNFQTCQSLKSILLFLFYLKSALNILLKMLLLKLKILESRGHKIRFIVTQVNIVRIITILMIINTFRIILKKYSLVVNRI